VRFGTVFVFVCVCVALLIDILLPLASDIVVIDQMASSLRADSKC